MKTDRGYTLLETAMLLVVLGTFLRLAIPNYLEIKERVADATAQRDFLQLKPILRRQSGDPLTGGPVLMLHQSDGQALPGPLDGVHLQPGVRVNYAVRIKFSPVLELSALEVGHQDGKHLFRLLEINEKGMEQIVRKNGRG